MCSLAGDIQGEDQVPLYTENNGRTEKHHQREPGTMKDI